HPPPRGPAADDGAEVRHGRLVLHAPQERQPPVHPGLRRRARPRRRRLHRRPARVRSPVLEGGAPAMPSFELHPEVLVLVGAVVAMGWWAVRVIGPKVVPAGEPVVTTGQRRWFAAGVAVLFVASMWPMHDISEQRLYSVHMVQHSLLSFVVPPMFLLATPRWLARLVVGEGTWLRRLCHPVLAGGLFNAVTVFLHWQWAVNTSVENGAVHYGLH